MAYEKIVAVYDRAEKAREAARALASSGFVASDISVLNSGSVSDQDASDSSVWQRLFGRSVRTRKPPLIAAPLILAGLYSPCEHPTEKSTGP